MEGNRRAQVCLASPYRRTTNSNGGGWLADLATADGKAYFGFSVRSDKKDDRVKGNSTFSFLGADGYLYVVRSTSWQNGYLQFSAEPDVTPAVFTRSNFKGRCSVLKLNPATGSIVSSWGNYTFEVFTRDGDLLEPRQPDSYAITVWDNHGQVWHQVGSRTSTVTLGGGNITNKN